MMRILWFMLVCVSMVETLAAEELDKGISLMELAATMRLEVYQVYEGAHIPLKRYDQTNNFKTGVNILPLSGCQLADINGIASIKVHYRGRNVPITDVPNLQVFLNNNQIAEVPAEVALLTNVTFFYFNDNKIRRIPAAFGQIAGLAGVYFSRNRIDYIAPDIFLVKKLRKFEIKQNRMRSIPQEIGEARHIIHLNLAYNPIGELPESITNLASLRICDFSFCGLRVLPEGFADNKVRYQLRLIGNGEMMSLPDGRGFRTMKGTIDISGTGIDEKRLPEDIRNRISRRRTPSPNKLVQVIKSS